MSSPHAKLLLNSDGTRMSGGVVLPDEVIEEVLSHLP
ncbi:hypothetical protein A2U01_0118778, partial [Trifolium medium]|nr:hypothetical protein [Trifolium medium]